MLNVATLQKSITPIIVMLVITALCSLGYWQLNRGWYKSQLIRSQAQAETADTISAVDLVERPINDLRYQKIQLHTTINFDQTLLLDNQMHEGKIGYHLFLPIHVVSNKFILLNIGWVPASPDRKILPDVQSLFETFKQNQQPLNNSEFTIEGYVEKGYVNPLISNVLESNQISWPLRVQHIDYALFSKVLGKELIPGTIIRQRPHIPGVLEHPKSQVWLTPEKHYGYAVQWFSLAAVFFVMVLLAYRKRKLKQS